MKNFLCIVFFAFALNTFGQDFATLQNYEFKSVESYKTQESEVLKCANYLFGNPADSSELNRLISAQFIMKWMEGTPDYTFSIDQKAMELTKGSTDLLGLYLAAMSKTVLEKPDTKLSNDEIYNASENLLVTYCSNKANNIKPSKHIKKLLKSKK
ncbi:hypothetical protein [Seonamhaeicola sp. ML3]|uniref:hypothetical protein n=1 Tax=Seonamhaeicola sp. ML3 TaxID=2937786 RepID=UPI00200DE19E|nr:hypothetical protein [Seonamhaeicola sp. ML3]